MYLVLMFTCSWLISRAACSTYVKACSCILRPCIHNCFVHSLCMNQKEGGTWMLAIHLVSLSNAHICLTTNQVSAVITCDRTSFVGRRIKTSQTVLENASASRIRRQVLIGTASLKEFKHVCAF